MSQPPPLIQSSIALSIVEGIAILLQSCLRPFLSIRSEIQREPANSSALFLQPRYHLVRLHSNLVIYLNL